MSENPATDPRASRATRAQGGPGRPPKALTPARLELICEKIRIGLPQETAAIRAGVPRRTFQDWLRMGRLPDAREPYKSMADAIEAALAEYHESRVQIVHDSPDQRTAQWALERRFPSEWGETRRLDANVNVTARPFVDVSKLTLDEQRTLLELLRKAAPEQEQLPKDGTPAILALSPGEAVEA